MRSFLSTETVRSEAARQGVAKTGPSRTKRTVGDAYEWAVWDACPYYNDDVKEGGDILKIDIKGTIVANDDKWIYEWLEYDAVCPRDVAQKISGCLSEDESLVLEINSGGGDLFAATEIYSELLRHKGKVTANIVGFAASAASVAAMAADEVVIAPSAMIMIHNPACSAYGDNAEHAHVAAFLESANGAVCEPYVRKTHKNAEEILPLMAAETWFNAQQAVEYGLADRIMDSQKTLKITNSHGEAPILSPSVIEKIKAMKQDLVQAKKTHDASASAKYNKIKIERERF